MTPVECEDFYSSKFRCCEVDVEHGEEEAKTIARKNMAEQNQNHPPNLRCEHCLAKFLPNQEDFVTSLHGHELTWNYVELHGFSNPIKVEHVNGLGLQVPLGDYKHFLNRLGGNRMVPVIHAEADKIMGMKLEDFIKHVTDPKKNEPYCVQSLELTPTEMQEEVSPPEFARSIDMIELAWSPPDIKPKSTGDKIKSTGNKTKAEDPERNGLKPEVNRFLQINMAGSYINFHLDATGSGIWHHVLRGTEVLYLIKGPVERIVTKYNEWYLTTYSHAANETSMEDDDELEFHRVEVSEGETIFLPGGFFRAMKYPVETIVIGGNYLNVFNLNTHLRLFQVETDYAINKDLRQLVTFPKFAEACWRYAYKVCRLIIEQGMFSFSCCIRDQLRYLCQYMTEGNGFDVVSEKLEKIGMPNILTDLAFILDNAVADPHNEGHFILNSEEIGRAHV